MARRMSAELRRSRPATRRSRPGVSLLIAYVIRGMWRLITRRRVLAPGWTPGVFYGAAVISVVETLSMLHR